VSVTGPQARKTEAEAQQAAQRELERMLSEARATAQPQRQLPVRQDHGKERSHSPDVGSSPSGRVRERTFTEH
jgi:hypothetical protein